MRADRRDAVSIVAQDGVEVRGSEATAAEEAKKETVKMRREREEAQAIGGVSSPITAARIPEDAAGGLWPEDELQVPLGVARDWYEVEAVPQWLTLAALAVLSPMFCRILRGLAPGADLQFPKDVIGVSPVPIATRTWT